MIPTSQRFGIILRKVGKESKLFLNTKTNKTKHFITTLVQADLGLKYERMFDISPVLCVLLDSWKTYLKNGIFSVNTDLYLFKDLECFMQANHHVDNVREDTGHS